MNWKELAKQAAVSLAVLYAYHNGMLDGLPVVGDTFKGSKKSK